MAKASTKKKRESALEEIKSNNGSGCSPSRFAKSMKLVARTLIVSALFLDCPVSKNANQEFRLTDANDTEFNFGTRASSTTLV